MRERWSNTSVALHWLAAALIVGLATAGFVMTDLPADSSGRLLISRMHTLGGATLMLLTVARLSSGAAGLRGDRCPSPSFTAEESE